MNSAPGALRVVIATVERLEKRHVVAWFNRDDPNILVFFRFASYQTKRCAKSLHAKRLHDDSPIADGTKLSQSLLLKVLRYLFIHVGACAQFIYASL